MTNKGWRARPFKIHEHSWKFVFQLFRASFRDNSECVWKHPDLGTQPVLILKISVKIDVFLLIKICQIVEGILTTVFNAFWIESYQLIHYLSRISRSAQHLSLT